MGVVIRRWVWLETIGVVSGCFPHKTYISLLHLYLLFFAAASLLLFSFVKIYIYTRTLHQPTRLTPLSHEPPIRVNKLGLNPDSTRVAFTWRTWQLNYGGLIMADARYKLI